MKSLAITNQGNSFIRERNRFRYTKDDLEYLAQKTRSVISIFLGEWFLDRTLGIPYIPKTDMKTGHRALLETSLRQKIAAVKGIKKLTAFNSIYQARERLLLIEFTAETDNGEILEMKEGWGGEL